MTEELPLCECGCGRSVTKKGNRFIKGHNRRNCKATEETKKKQSIALTGRKPTCGFKGYKHTKAAKLKQSQNARDSSGINNPNYGKDFSGENNPSYGLIRSDETKKKNSDAMIKFYQYNPKAIKRFTKQSQEYWADKNNRDAMSEIITNSEAARVNADNMRGGDDIVNHHIAYDFGRFEALTVKITRKFHSQIHNPKGCQFGTRGYSLID